MCPHFGSAPFFAIQDLQAGTLELLENNHDNHEHGSCTPVGLLQELGVEMVVCQGMGLRAIQNLKVAGIKVRQSQPAILSEILGNLESLPEMSGEGACQGHDCH